MRVCLGSTLIQGYGLTEVTACATLMAMDDLGTEVCGIPNQVRKIIPFLQQQSFKVVEIYNVIRKSSQLL